MTIVHLSFDYPDIIIGKKTKAVHNLITSQHVADNVVFSLNRTSYLFNKLKVNKEAHGYTMYIYGLPFGILLFPWMFIAYRRILKVIIADNIKPSLIHAHKLTFEGIIAFYLAKKLKIPYILTIRGDSDLRVLRFKRLYRRGFIRIVQNSKKAIVLAPWALKYLIKTFGKQVPPDKFILIPNIVPVDQLRNFENVKTKKFLTAFHFEDYKRKNIKRIIQALDPIFVRYPDFSLDIIGGGTNRDKIISLINKSKHPDKFFLLGEIENSLLLKMYSRYWGFVLPSYPETFGLVFLEALAAGIPVIYSKNSGIDGYFNDYNIGIGVNPKSIDEIASAIEDLIMKNMEFTKNIEIMIASGFINRFSREAVGIQYTKVLQDVIPGVQYDQGR